jgi:exonuclease SbcC
MRIKKISIQNFKIFRRTVIDFESANAVVFDGPNGFGKTTIYDAIELMFTGKIRRYSDLKARLIDGRQTFSENPFYHDNGAGQDVSITVEFSKGSSTWILERLVQFDEISYNLDFSVYKLFTKPDFESSERFPVSDEARFLEEIFGDDYSSNFQFLNYIEQEECLFLLKHTDKNRKEHIGHLFDLKGFEEKVDKIEILKRKVDILCNSSQKTDLDELENETIQLRQKVSDGVEASTYARLFEDKDFLWDKENFEINTINYDDILGVDGVLERLNKIVQIKEIVKQYQKNRAVNYLLENEALLRRFFKFYGFLTQKEEFRHKKKQNEALRHLLSQLDNLTNDLLTKEFELDTHAFISSELANSFVKRKGELLRNIQELSALDVIYSDISASRGLLKEKLTSLKDAGIANGECVLCGQEWGTINNLLNQIDLRSQQIKDINSARTNQFGEKFSSFKSGVVKDLIEVITHQLSELSYDPFFVDELLITESHQFASIIKSLEFLKIEYLKFIDGSQEIKSNAEESINSFKDEIGFHKSPIKEELIESYLDEYLRKYFDNDADKINQISNQRITQKKQYLYYLWFNSQNGLLQSKIEELKNKRIKYNKAKSVSELLNSLKGTYIASLKKFQKNIVKDIEVIFHIYSGRIMQSFHGGAGLFIYSDKDGIRFQSSPQKTYDAVFSMSSGQLSALIIAFTLALHKKYSQNKVILIDDPVQTMDELNLYGFIDLLRNEFSDNQIIISTHEDMMSAFIRYKFKNYNMSERRINLKELLSKTEL